jgi:hypothetical protein
VYERRPEAGGFHRANGCCHGVRIFGVGIAGVRVCGVGVCDVRVPDVCICDVRVQPVR